MTDPSSGAKAPLRVVDRLAQHATERPEALAFTFHPSGERLDYHALRDRVSAAAARLAARDVRPKDRVCLVLTTSPELVTLILASQWLGAIPVVVNPALPDAALALRRELVGARLTVGAALAESLAAPGPPAGPMPVGTWDPADIAYIQLTSGTTGEPRAAAVSHAALHHYTADTADILTLPDDLIVSWMPLHHDLGLVRYMFVVVYLGLHAHLLPPKITSLGVWLRTISETRATLTGAPDFAYRLAARSVPPEGIDLTCLRLATNGGEPVRATTIASFEERFGCPGVVRPGYGLAEATLGATLSPPGAPLSVDGRGNVGTGPPLGRLETRVTHQGRALEPGAPGDVELRGPHLFSGYFDPSAPERLDRAAFTSDGWLRTGDIGYLDPAGELFILGRARAMVKQAGCLIAPRELEEVVDHLPGVRLSAAVGLPNAWSEAEELVVVVEARRDPPPPELTHRVIEAIRRQVGVSPGRVLLVPAKTIPKTANGKIRHAALKRLLTGSAIG